MAVYDYATTFTQLLQQKYAKELCSDALTQSNQQVKFINAQTIKLPRMTVLPHLPNMAGRFERNRWRTS